MAQGKLAIRTRHHKTGPFCSLACARKYLVGPRNPLWRGGSDPNRGSAWVKLSEAIRKRDGYCCRRCGKRQDEQKIKLAVDHIRPWRSFTDKSLANQPDNLAALCSECHGHKTHVVERAWLMGDVLPLLAFERAINGPSAATFSQDIPEPPPEKRRY
jgi:5-methylcytosine-specific restriction endonuclease McrA